MSSASNENNNPYLLGVAGLCCVLIGIGICRFGYTPILPYLIEDHWLTKAQADFIGSANFIGYLIGALCSWNILKIANKLDIVKYSIISCIIGLMACSFNFGFFWILSWRLSVGFFGALLMIVTPSVILKKVAFSSKGLASGIIFSGVGIGILFSGIVTPWIHSLLDLQSVWLTFFCLSLIVGGIIAKILSTDLPNQKQAVVTETTQLKLSIKQKWQIFFIGFAYLTCGIGFVPHSLFWVEYAREKNLTTCLGSLIWSFFGLGFIIGGVCLGKMGDKFGIHKILMAIYFLSSLSVGIVLFNQSSYVFGGSAFLTGIFMAGILTLTSARIAEIVGTRAHTELWGKITLCYASSQAFGAYAMSHLINNSVGYATCILLASIAFIISTICMFFSNYSNP
ncbi:MAG: YbfB/YjiJ family MFS transporter [Gammaproteobacteria bacterium]|nr:YbfB/YjiJ family MFS transporter [Gammaproteobacteria bacterium]